MHGVSTGQRLACDQVLWPSEMIARDSTAICYMGRRRSSGPGWLGMRRDLASQGGYSVVSQPPSICSFSSFYCLVHGASVRLLPGVRPLVRRNDALAAEAPRAHGLSVWLLAGMRPLVPGNGALIAEAS